jgi:hypothetical protein
VRGGFEFEISDLKSQISNTAPHPSPLPRVQGRGSKS